MTMTIHLQVWRQAGAGAAGRLVPYTVDGVDPDMSFLEMLDLLNETLAARGEDPVAFDSDCREGICGACGVVIDGVAHGPKVQTTTCELRMRAFRDGQRVVVEPFRAAALPVVKDLVVDRSALDRIIARGGYVSINTGSAPDGNALPIAKDDAEMAMDAAACIGCAACVAACPNASASLFAAAKIAQMTHLPQGHAERARRVAGMVDQMDAEGFGDCSNHGECEAVCPKGIAISNIALMRREYARSLLEAGER